MLDTWLNRKTILTLCCGLSISFAVFFLLKGWEETNRQNEFNYKALDHAVAIQSEFEHLANNVAQARFLIEHDINIEHDNPNNPDDFMPMAEQIIIHDPNLLSIAWTLVQGRDKQQYLNVTYVKPGKHNSNEVSDIQIDEYYDEHFDTSYILDKSRLVSAFIHKDAGVETNELNFIAPVANRMQNSDQFNGQHIGSLIVELEVSGLIERAIEKLPVSAQDISLAVLHRDGKKEIVYQHLSRSRSAHEMSKHTGLRSNIPFDFAGLQWHLEFEAAPAFFRNHPIILAWQSLFLCLLLTLFFVWYTQLNSKQTQKVEQQVIARTKELEHSKNNLRRIIDNLQDVYFQTDVENIVKICSPSIFNLLGYTKEEVIGTHIIKYYARPELREKLLTTLQASKSGKLFNYEGEALHRDGHHLWISTNIQFTYDTQGNIDGIEGTIRNITELKQAEQEKEGLQRQIEHTQRLESLGVLAGGIAHDFNNILAAIMGNASLAEHKVVDRPHDSKEHLGKIIHASEKAAALCQQMLAYAGKGRFIIEPLNLSVLLDEVTQLLEVPISPNVNIHYNLQDHLPQINGDKAQLQQLFMNFITNANESINDNGDITISTGNRYVSLHDLKTYLGSEQAIAGDYIYITFSDTGCGMNKGIIDKIFEPFFTTKFTGRGLGMSAVLGIIKGHQGFIQCESEVGQGTTFTVLFPISEAQADPLPDEITANLTQQNTGMVLIIDDEDSIREMAQEMLIDLGWQTLSAADGASGVALFRQHRDNISTVILDMTMPGMDGLSTFDAIIAIDPKAKVILSTGYSQQEATDRFAGKALAGFLQKPYDFKQLQDKIAQATA